ncbi:MAG: T9SS type A sorting domain-containing protein, partial [Bacteroidia bacterium]
GVWYVSAYYSPQVTNAVWYWGDGTSTAGMSPGHNYASAGQYNICVTAYSACGDSAVACQNDSLYRNNQNNNPNSVISVTVLNENGVGIKTISQSQFVSIYPNPSTGIFTLQLKNISSGDSKAKIYVTNVLGEVVYLAEERLGNNSFSKEIDLQSAANGTYFVKAVVGSKIYNSKITISR